MCFIAVRTFCIDPVHNLEVPPCLAGSFRGAAVTEGMG